MISAEGIATHGALLAMVCICDRNKLGHFFLMDMMVVVKVVVEHMKVVEAIIHNHIIIVIIFFHTNEQYNMLLYLFL